MAFPTVKSAAGITFVTFHADLSTDKIEALRRHGERIGTSSFHWEGAECHRTARELMRAMFASVSRTHPGCRKVILTDRDTSLASDGGVEVMRTSGGCEHLMLDRSVAWVNFIRRAPRDAHVVFLDYDMIVQRSLRSVFDVAFDVGLTFRSHSRWPINAGIQFLHASRLDRALGFFEKALAIFTGSFRDWLLWGGEQWALRELVRTVEFERDAPFLDESSAHELLLLPCDEYNFSPSVGDWDISDPSYGVKKVLHFKGKHKRTMLEYVAQIDAAEGVSRCAPAAAEEPSHGFLHEAGEESPNKELPSVWKA